MLKWVNTGGALATVLYLVRHGETSLNRERIFQGHLDPELSELGREQAKRLALRLEGEEIGAFYSSDLVRAYQNAAAIAAKHRQGVVKMKELRGIESNRIRDIRGLGLMIGIELKEKAGQYVQELMDKGVIVLLAGVTVIRLLPPLVISREEIDTVVKALKEVLGG